MDFTSTLLLCLICCVIGAIIMLLIQYYCFVKYLDEPKETVEQKTINEKYLLPDAILANINSPDPDSKNPIIAFNLIFQFLFYELRNASKVRKWFYRKLTLELDELISKTTTGKFFDKLSVRDLDLGAQFPVIKNIRVHNADLHDTEGHLESLDLLLDIYYNGNFKISIDADMVLGKKGFLSVKVKHISGLARLQFTRKPYTHWSLCFLGDPRLDLDIETQFQGRQMQSNVASLITNQIKKAIRRKHTLPNYKLRYKPFFHRTEEEVDISDVVLDGTIEVNISELSRLKIPPQVNNIYCTLTLASIPWVLARQHDDRNIIVSLDIAIHKAKNQQIGIVFKQTEHCVLVEAVIPNTPASKAKLCKSDVLIAIEGREVTHINNISKIIKSLNRSVFMLRIERTIPGLIKNDAILEDFEVYEDFNDFNITFSKNTDSVQIGTKTRKNSIDKSMASSGESSRSNTPTNSPRKQDDRISAKPRRSLSRGNSDAKTIPIIGTAAASATSDDSPSINILKTVKTPHRDNNEPIKATKEDHLMATPEPQPIIIDYHFQQHSTIDCSVNSLITMNDLAQFKLNEHLLHFNLNVFGRCNEDTTLLGYLNIPVHNVLAECADSNLGQFVKQYPLIPPSTPNLAKHPLSMQSGFDPYLCFGDVLLSFVWTDPNNLIPAASTGGTAAAPSTPIAQADTAGIARKAKVAKTASEKLAEDERNNFDAANLPKQHDFIRTHFQRSTQCDFCGKKIWLKDAVQCRDCAMCCHKKCINKCQNSTICGPVDSCAAAHNSSPSTSSMPSVEFRVTDADCDNMDNGEETMDEPRPILEQHRQSFSEMITQGLKRVNSANNLAIPGIVTAINQAGSRSLPPSPQHTPRKQSLVNQSPNPFVAVAQKLELLPDDIGAVTREQIGNVTESLIGCGASPDELMELAKMASRSLYADLEPNERVIRINILLSKLRLALDSETTAHANLTTSTGDLSKISTITHQQSTIPMDSIRLPSDTSLLLQTKGPATVSASQQNVTTTIDSPAADAVMTISKGSGSGNSQHEIARKAFLVGQSEERVQALSVIMLYLCTGLQYAQGVASQ